MDSQNTKVIQLFGDESNYEGIVTYAFVIVPLKLKDNIEAEILKIKTDFGIDPEYKIHCRELFHYHAREKSGFRDFTKEKVFNLLESIGSAFYGAGGRAWVGCVNPSDTPDSIVSISPEGVKAPWDISNVKIKTIFAYQSAISPIIHDIPTNHLDVWVDGDSSKVLHIKHRLKADSLKSITFEPNAQRFLPIPVYKHKSVFLELADILAYASSHAFPESSHREKQQFARIMSNFNPGISISMFDDLQPDEMSWIRTIDVGGIRKYLRSFMT